MTGLPEFRINYGWIIRNLATDLVDVRMSEETPHIIEVVSLEQTPPSQTADQTSHDSNAGTDTAQGSGT